MTHEPNIIQGDDTLSSKELLTLLLSFVFPLPKARHVSKTLLSQSSLHSVLTQNDPVFLKSNGLTKKAMELLKVVGEIQDFLLRPSLKKEILIKGASDVVAYCRHKIAFEPTEMLLVLLLDNDDHVMSEEIFYKGTVDSVTISPRDIFKYALDKNASSIILVHNHTSGNTTPSLEDVMLTEHMLKASDVLNVAIFDHIIIGPEDYISIRSLGLISYKGWEKSALEKD